MTPEELKFAAEYHRGFEDGKAARDADQWQLDRERKAVAARLQVVNPSELCGSHESLSAICKAVHEPMMGWTMGACESLRNRLIYLLGGETTNSDAEISAKVVQNGEKHQLATYDVLGNERHKVVCELRKMRLDTGTAIKKLAIALGIRWNAANAPKSCALIQSRLIHLLGGDDETASNDDKTCPITVQSPSITDELRKWASGDVWSRKWDEFDAIADRIDEQFERICSQQEAVLQQTVSETVDKHEREMAELRADYEQAISDITGVERGEGSDLLIPVDVFLHVRDTLRHDIEMWRDRAEDMRKERDDLQDRLQAISVLCEQDDG